MEEQVPQWVTNLIQKYYERNPDKRKELDDKIQEYILFEHDKKATEAASKVIWDEWDKNRSIR